MSASRRSFLAKTIGLLLGSITNCFASAKKQTVPQKQIAVSLPNNEVYLRGDKAYEAQRRAAVWQSIKPERFPDQIIKARSEADIVEIIKYANANKLPVSVRCGGHSYVASPLRNGGILLDVSALRDIEIDPEKRQVKTQPGIGSAEFSAMLEEHGLGFPIAHCPTVTLGGYLLGGGMGWNGGYWGQFACFNVRAVDLVMANGELIHADENSHADLFWAARGAGPAFCAVVTQYYLDVFPMPKAITSSTYIYSMDALDSVVDWLEAYKSQQHLKIELTVIFTTDDSSKSSDPAKDRQCIVSAICFADDKNEAAMLLEEIARDAPNNSRLYSAEYESKTMQAILATSKAVVPHRHAVDTMWTSHTDQALREIGEHFINTPSSETHVFANYRAESTLIKDAAYSIMAPMFILSSSTWAAQEDDAECLRWSDELMEKLKPINEGSYINETDFIRHPERAQQCFSSASLSQLKTVCDRYDPEGMFTSPFELG
ncbi:MAG: FAD/FMN-containing dehydrogenase [Gammaproteobacteria bacterium]|jgi:FAD/FMN-containing dehydrogenase